MNFPVDGSLCWLSFSTNPTFSPQEGSRGRHIFEPPQRHSRVRPDLRDMMLEAFRVRTNTVLFTTETPVYGMNYANVSLVVQVGVTSSAQCQCYPPCGPEQAFRQTFFHECICVCHVCAQVCVPSCLCVVRRIRSALKLNNVCIKHSNLGDWVGVIKKYI